MADRTHDLDAATSRPTERSDQFLSLRVLQREGAKVMADLGLEVRPAQVRILIKGFVESGRTKVDPNGRTSGDDDSNLRGYIVNELIRADPTALKALRSIARQRGESR